MPLAMSILACVWRNECNVTPLIPIAAIATGHAFVMALGLCGVQGGKYGAVGWGSAHAECETLLLLRSPMATQFGYGACW